MIIYTLVYSLIEKIDIRYFYFSKADFYISGGPRKKIIRKWDHQCMGHILF
jgi:hypothetical protein